MQAAAPRSEPQAAPTLEPSIKPTRTVSTTATPPAKTPTDGSVIEAANNAVIGFLAVWRTAWHNSGQVSGYGSDAVRLRDVHCHWDGSFKGGAYVGTLANGGAVLAPLHDFSTQVPASLQQELAQIGTGIASGSIQTPTKSPV